MSNDTEMMADIVAEMGRRENSRYYPKVARNIMRQYRTRIEAAWKRERDILIYSFDPTKAAKSLAPDGSAWAIEGMESDPAWKDICAKCHDGEIEPECEYYGEPNGCNSPIYGERPKSSAAMRDALVLAVKTLFAWRRDLPYRAWHEVEAVIGTCNAVLKEGGAS